MGDAGADVIHASHGSRQIESAPPMFPALPEVRAVPGPELPLFYDSGLRSDEDALKPSVDGG